MDLDAIVEIVQFNSAYSVDLLAPSALDV